MLTNDADVDVLAAKRAHELIPVKRAEYEQVCDARGEAWLRLSKAGWSLRRIAMEMGVSHDRVRDALTRAKQRDHAAEA